MSDFDVTETRRIYEGVLSNVRVDRLRGPDGSEFEREIVEHVDAVAVVPVTPNGDVVLLRQYRHPIGSWLVEIPAGICDVDGEDLAGTAARELAEETGLQATDLTELTTIETTAGWSDERNTIFLATGVSSADRPDGFVAEDEEAAMEIVSMPLDQAADAASDGRITDAKTAVGLLAAARRLGR